MSAKAHSPYDRPERKSLDFKDDPGLTKQSFVEDCNINTIIAKAIRGKMPELVTKNPLYGDFSAVPDYMESLNIVNKAHAQFNNLPANVRNRFANDPARFLDFMGDAANTEEAIKLGLATRKVEVVVPESSTPSPAVPVPPALSGGSGTTVTPPVGGVGR